jgi:hypothetical protein
MNDTGKMVPLGFSNIAPTVRLSQWMVTVVGPVTLSNVDEVANPNKRSEALAEKSR